MDNRGTGDRRRARLETHPGASEHVSTRSEDPLLDRLTFHKRSQHASESIGKYYAHLKILYIWCGFDLDMSYGCLQGGCNGKEELVCKGCGEVEDIDARFRQRTLRDQLIFGLQDQTMQEEVLKGKPGDLTLNKGYLQVAQGVNQVAGQDPKQGDTSGGQERGTLWRSGRQEEVKLQARQAGERQQQQWGDWWQRWWQDPRRRQDHH